MDLVWITVIVVILTIAVVLLYSAIKLVPKTNNNIEYFDYDWSDRWTELDRVAREGNDCKPVYKVQRMLGKMSSWIWMVPKTCEEGLPHTRGIDVIALPIDLPKSRVAQIVAHEKIHLLQRLNTSSWERFYRQKWNYEIYSQPPIGMPEDLIKRRRGNPDTADAPWCCWKKRWWPVAVYTNVSKPSLKGATIRWWDATTTSIRETPPEDWLQFFGNDVQQNEHPHEITAEFLSGPLYNNGLPVDPPPAMSLLKQSWVEDAHAPTV